jgi:hypothetical protein
MNKKITIWAIIIIVIFVGVSLYAKYKNDNKVDYSRDQSIEEAEQRPLTTISAKHQYRDGQHVFLGSFNVPSPCHSHNSEVIQRENVIEVALTYDSNNEVCAQVIEERQFKVEFEGTGEEDVIATLNGEAVNFNIFEVGPDEDISEVEIFIKG